MASAIITYVDADIYGRHDAAGNLVEHRTDDLCVSNALVAWLTSDVGDYIYSPDIGGLLWKSLYKVMTPVKIKALKDTISETIAANFSDVLTVTAVNITQDNQSGRTYNIEILYKSLLSNQNIMVAFDTKPRPEPIQTYLDVAYTGENAYTFTDLQLPFQKGLILQKNPDDGLYYWGKYRFTNLQPTDPKFKSILDLTKSNI